MGRRDGMSRTFLVKFGGGPGSILGSLKGQEREADVAWRPGHLYLYFLGASVCRGFPGGSSGPVGSLGTAEHPGLLGSWTFPWRVPKPTLTSSASHCSLGPLGSTQTVLTVLAAKVLLSTCDRHLHAGRAGRGLPRGGGRGTGKPEGEPPEGVVVEPWESGKAEEARREPGRIGPARAGCWRSGLR